ncbi:unnamed protein product, partial [Rotaria sp. Silwood1]
MKEDFEENQRWSKIVCYETLSCNSGMLCLDWRNICDRQQQCMNGLDEENCDKLEFNECEEDEYRCGNGMCINEIYFLDAWTMPSGMCEFEPGYDDPRFNITTLNVKSIEACSYLLRCALTSGFERDCPCVYSRSEQLLKHKQERYFNQTDISNNHPYSVRFEAFELTHNETKALVAWNYPIYFDYLPSFRLATPLKFPETYLSRSHHPCINITCNSNSICIPFFNNRKWSYLCSFVQYYDADNITLNLILRQQQLFIGTPSHIHFRHTQIEAPVLGILKLHVSLTSTNYYILYVQPHTSVINITSAPEYCPHASLLFQKNDDVPLVFKYHRICQNNSFQLCFYDSTYFCMCQGSHMQAYCFNYDPFLDRCDSCLSSGKCVRGDPQDSNDFSCLCPYCHSGRLCEFSMQPFTFTLDSLLAFDSIFVQLVYIIIALVIVITGFLNNFLSFVTFRRPEPRKTSV